jgi:hypothetical protein
VRCKRVRLLIQVVQNSKGQTESGLRKGFFTETIMTPLKANDEMEVMVLKDLAEICKKLAEHPGATEKCARGPVNS